MKKLLRFTRLMVCLCAVLSSTTAFAAADWVGAGAIKVNGTWYRADTHESNGWAGNNFDGANLGNLYSYFKLGGQVQLYENNGVQWDSNSNAKMLYKFDDSTDFTELLLNWYKFGNNNNFFQSGGNDFSATTIDIRTLSLGSHTLTVKFVDVDGLKPTTEFTANFTKVAYDISNATVTAVDDKDWTGSVIHPVPVVKAGDITLESGTDYTVAYNNTDFTSVGEHSVVINGKADNFTGSQTVTFNIKNPAGYYVVRKTNSWALDTDYLLTKNTGASGDEYVITNVALTTTDEFKVIYYNGTDGSNYTWYPSGTNNNYGENGEIAIDGTYTIYFRPNGDGGSDWFYNVIYVPLNKVTLDEEGTNNSTILDNLNGKTVDVTLNRTLKTGGWNTFCAPFNTAIPAGWTVRELTGASYNNDNGKQLSLTFGGASSIEAGKPYLVKVSSQVTNPVFTGVRVNKNPNPTTISGIVSFIPVMSPTQLATDKTELFITVSGGKSYLTYPSSASSINGFRAYFKLLDEASGARVFNLDLDDDDATGISLVLNDETTKDNGIYMLDGRRVQGQPTQKGVYIVNGKKRIIK